MTSTLRGGPAMKIFGHRGAAAVAPENTIASFRRALTDGADGIELDVMRCGSGEVIVFHDDELGRLAHRPGRARELPWSELATVKVLDQAPIPLLADVLDEFGGKTTINIELKTQPQPLRRLDDDGLARLVARELEARRLYDDVIVSSFDPLLLLRFRVALPRVRLALLLSAESSRPLREGWSMSLFGSDLFAVHPQASLVSTQRLHRWRRAGLRVHPWTVDRGDELRWLCGLAVDGVITNDPAAARRILGEPTPTIRNAG